MQNIHIDQLHSPQEPSRSQRPTTEFCQLGVDVAGNGALGNNVRGVPTASLSGVSLVPACGQESKKVASLFASTSIA